jgi:hypothetical protein
MTIATIRISGNRKRKNTGKQLITYFQSTLEAPGNTESDTDAYLDKSTIIFTNNKLQGNTKEEMGKEDNFMEDHSKHPCKQQRMEQERIIPLFSLFGNICKRIPTFGNVKCVPTCVISWFLMCF